MSDGYVHTVALMGTVVTMHVVAHGTDEHERRACEQAVERAVGWFLEVERTCTRFDPESELCRLSTRSGVPVPVSALLFEAVRFALAVAEESDGAFDPTVGRRMEERGFNREYRSGKSLRNAIELEGEASASSASFRDVLLDERDAGERTVMLRRPLLLDLGAVAKGLAIDLAARELRAHENFAIDAGGDLYCGGRNAHGDPWSVGIRHPRNEHELIDTLRVSNVAVCTSGGYERRIPSLAHGGETAEHHILHPRTGTSPTAVASATVVAPTAMVADALATAAFVLGPTNGLRLIERHGVDGLLLTATLDRFTTPGFRDRYHREHATVPARA